MNIDKEDNKRQIDREKVLEILIKISILIPGFIIYLKIEGKEVTSIGLLTPIIFYVLSALISRLPMKIFFKNRVRLKSNVLSFAIGMTLFLILLKIIPSDLYIFNFHIPVH